MQNILASMLQTNPLAVAPLDSMDQGSIWHHMSEALHQSLYRVLTLLIAVLPGILAFFVTLAIFAFCGIAISWLMRRCLSWIKFDMRLARMTGDGWTPSSPPTEITVSYTHLDVYKRQVPFGRGSLPADSTVLRRDFDSI